MKYAIIFLILITMVLPLSSASSIVYVDTDGSGDYNCDGIDDHIQINQALDYVANNVGFTTVHLNGPNTYWINSTLFMGNDTILEGDSTAEIKLVANAGLGYLVPMIENKPGSSNNFTIRGFEIDGNSENQSVSRGAGYHNMMYFRDCYYVTVTNMRLEWGCGDGLKVQQSAPGGVLPKAYVTFNNNSVYKLGHDALYVLQLDNVTVANNDVFTRTNSAFRFSTSGNAKVYNNTIHSEFAGWSTGPGIEIDKNPGRISENISIYNNTFHTLNGAGIWITNEESDDSILGRDVHIHHNIFYNVGQYWNDTGYSNAAIIIGQSDNTIIENNVIDNGGHAGIKYYIRPHYYHINALFTTIVRNNIIMNADDHTAAGIWNCDDTNHIFISEYNCIYNNTGGAYSGTSITANNDIRVDPLFYDTANHNYHLNSTAGTWNGAGWEIKGTYSPCIDAGNSSSDYSNEPSPNGNRINIGRYGNTAEASRSVSPLPDPLVQGKQFGVTVYPNPAKEIVNFRFEVSGPADITIKIFNIAGVQVSRITRRIDENQLIVRWHTDQTEPGVYLYQVYCNGTSGPSGKICLKK